MFTNYINFIFNQHPLPTSISINDMIKIFALIEKKYWKKNNQRLFIQLWVNNSIIPYALSEKQLDSIEMEMNNNCLMWYHRIPILYSTNIEGKEIISEVCNLHATMKRSDFNKLVEEELTF